MRQHFVFTDERSGGHLRHHESGIEACAGREKWRQTLAERGIHEAFQTALADAGECAQRDREKVEREGDGLAVKISAREHIAFAIDRFGIFHEDEGIVDGGVDLALKYCAAMSERVADSTVYLRYAAK